MSAAHTPLPWHVDHHVHIKAENGWRVASVNTPSGSVGSWGVSPSDNARFIVHAANCHDELLAQLEYAVKLLGAFPTLNGTAQVQSMRDTIAKALGRTPNEIGDGCE